MSDERDRRSPYLILGIDYGASLHTARQAFAQRARRLRRSENAVYSVEDLTWALHTIETLDDPAASVEYFRVPAHRADAIGPRDGDLFQPGPKPAPRRSQPVGPDVLAALDEQAAAHLVERLLTTANLVPSNDPYGA